MASGGAMSKRRGLDGFTPESWADGAKGWDGYRGTDELPVTAESIGRKNGFLGQRHRPCGTVAPGSVEESPLARKRTLSPR